MGRSYKTQVDFQDPMLFKDAYFRIANIADWETDTRTKEEEKKKQ